VTVPTGPCGRIGQFVAVSEPIATEDCAVKYLLLLYDDVGAVGALTPDERRAMVDDHIAYAGMLRERGAYVYGDPLDDPATARTLRFAPEAEPVVTDGPFLETKEALGGFYVIECASGADAVELAAQVPRSPGLVAELRPIPDMGAAG
jgi:hypothetical protein